MARILRGLFRGLWDEVLVELLKGGFKGGKELFAERIQSYIKTNPRAALVITLLSLEPEERVNLMEAHRRAMRGGWENRFVLELGQALPRKPDGGVDEPRAREVLKQLNGVSPEELNQFLEFLNHDPIAQWLRHWVLGRGQEAFIGFAEALTELAACGTRIAEERWPKAVNQLKEADNSMNDAILTWRSKKRWWLRRSRSRQRQLQSQLDAREERLRQQREQQTRDRVAEFFDQFRDERDERGGQQ